MTKNYYRSEYSDKQWKALIDKATELGCQITYSKYGNIVTIDSTDRESLIIAQTGRGRPGELNNSSNRERRTGQSRIGRENTRRDTGEHKPQNVESAAQEIPQRLLSDYLQESEVG